MSDAHRIVLVMDYEAENAARISGLCAMIALPMVRTDDGMFRRRVIEVEYRPGQWEAVEGIEVKENTLMMWRGSNGSTIRFSVPATRCPRWRADKAESRTLIDDDDPRPRCAR